MLTERDLAFLFSVKILSIQQFLSVSGVFIHCDCDCLHSQPLLSASGEEPACNHKDSEEMVRRSLWDTSGLFLSWRPWRDSSWRSPGPSNHSGQPGEHYESHVFQLLRCIQHYPSSSTGWEADSNAGGFPLVTRIMDYLTARPQYVHLQHCVR